MNHLENDVNAGPATSKPLLALACVFLAIPVVALLWVSTFAKVEPTLAGFPFFIWYQFAWVIAGAGITAFVYLVTTPRRRGGPPPDGGGATYPPGSDPRSRRAAERGRTR